MAMTLSTIASVPHVTEGDAGTPGVGSTPAPGQTLGASDLTDLTDLSALTEQVEIDPLRFREALGHYASGITVVTTMLEGQPVGFTCQSFYSVSMDPPLVSFSVMKTSTSYPAIRESGSFTVNVLAQDQRELSNQFARRGEDKWAGVDWAESRHGNPVLADTVMWVDCRLEQEVDAGDHFIVLGHVRQLNEPQAHRADPLLFFRGRYRELTAEG